MKSVTRWAVVLLLALSMPAGAKDGPALTLSKGARIGIVNLLDPEITHFHSSNVIQDSFLKTHSVNWTVDSMLVDAVRQRLAQLGLEAVPMAASEALVRGRQEFFVEGTVNKGLSRACAAQFTQMAAAERIDAFIVLAPGLNDSAHAAGARRRDLPDYLRGWGFVTKAEDPAGTRPAIFNMTQMLLISGTGGTALLRAREWGGDYAYTWGEFTSPANLRDVPDAEIDTLKPIFTGIATRQSNRLLDQVYVVGVQ